MSETALWGLIGLAVALFGIAVTFFFAARSNRDDKGKKGGKKACYSFGQFFSSRLCFASSKSFLRTTGILYSGLESILGSASTPAPSPTISAMATETPEPVVQKTFDQGILAAATTFQWRSRRTVPSFASAAKATSIRTAGKGLPRSRRTETMPSDVCSNGAVVFAGKNVSGENDVAGWSDIVQVSACYEGTVGVTEDGHVLYTGFDWHNRSDCTNWTGIVKILGGEDHVLGLTSDGRVVASGYSGDGRRDLSDLRDVVEGDAANGTTFCVLSDGSVVARGANWAGEDNVGGWSGIVAVSGGDEHTVGLKQDGTVVAIGSNKYGQCNVRDWTDIIAICAGQFHTIGVKSDGTMVATGSNDHGQCNVSNVKLW